MRPVPTLLTCVALVALAAPAPAAPIRATYEVTDQSGILMRGPVSFSGTLDIQQTKISPIGQGAPFFSDIGPISAGFRLSVSFDRESEGPVAAEAPSLVYDVHMEGALQPNSYPDGSWDWRAKATWEEPDVSTAITDWSTDSTIPLPLLKFFRDEAIFTGSVYSDSGGPANQIYVSLLHPPIPAEYLAEPVPEPSALAAWGVVALVVLAYRLRHRAARPVGLLVALMLVLLAAPASAAPIRAAVLQRSHGGTDSILFPEDFATQGGTIVLGTTYAGNYRPESPPYDHVNHAPLPWRVPLQDGFGVTLIFDGASPDLPYDQFPRVVIGANLVGELGYSAADARNLHGSWEGKDIGVGGPSGSDLASLPEDQRGVIETLLDTDRLSISGYVYGGGANAIDIILTVAPAPVPEPSTLAAWGAVGLAGLAIRHRRRRRTAATGASS